MEEEEIPLRERYPQEEDETEEAETSFTWDQDLYDQFEGNEEMQEVLKNVDTKLKVKDGLKKSIHVLMEKDVLDKSWYTNLKLTDALKSPEWLKTVDDINSVLSSENTSIIINPESMKAYNFIRHNVEKRYTPKTGEVNGYEIRGRLFIKRSGYKNNYFFKAEKHLDYFVQYYTKSVILSASSVLQNEAGVSSTTDMADIAKNYLYEARLVQKEMIENSSTREDLKNNIRNISKIEENLNLLKTNNNKFRPIKNIWKKTVAGKFSKLLRWLWIHKRYIGVGGIMSIVTGTVTFLSTFFQQGNIEDKLEKIAENQRKLSSPKTSPEKKIPEKKIPEKKIPEKKIPEKKIPEKKIPPPKTSPEKKIPPPKTSPEKKIPEKKIPPPKIPVEPYIDPKKTDEFISSIIVTLNFLFYNVIKIPFLVFVKIGEVIKFFINNSHKIPFILWHIFNFPYTLPFKTWEILKETFYFILKAERGIWLITKFLISSIFLILSFLLKIMTFLITGGATLSKFFYSLPSKFLELARYIFSSPILSGIFTGGVSSLIFIIHSGKKFIVVSILGIIYSLVSMVYYIKSTLVEIRNYLTKNSDLLLMSSYSSLGQKVPEEIVQDLSEEFREKERKAIALYEEDLKKSSWLTYPLKIMKNYTISTTYFFTSKILKLTSIPIQFTVSWFFTSFTLLILIIIIKWIVR